MSRTSWLRLLAMMAAISAGATGCTSIGPSALQNSRLHYNEVIMTTTEEQLLLNSVRLRYAGTPSSLAVSSIAAQFERT